MKQILIAGVNSPALEKSCGKTFRCTSEEEAGSIENFVREVKTDVILCGYDRFIAGARHLSDISYREKVPVIIVLDRGRDGSPLIEHLENPLIDFIGEDSSEEELKMRMEKIISTRNTNMSLGTMTVIQHEVNRMAKLSVAGELISSISHMINNPITAVNLQIDLLRMDKNISKEAIAKLDMIEGNIERIISIVATVRELKLGAADRNSLVSINEETMKYIPLLHDYFINHNINITHRIDDKLPPVRLPSGLLKYVFLEIMLLLFHRCRERRGGKVDISVLSENGNVRFVFGTDFECGLEKIGMDDEAEVDRSDNLTISALKADLSEAGGMIYMEDGAAGGRIVITVPAASI